MGHWCHHLLVRLFYFLNFFEALCVSPSSFLKNRANISCSGWGCHTRAMCVFSKPILQARRGEVANYVADWCPGSALGRLSFVAHSIGGLMVRAASTTGKKNDPKSWLEIPKCFLPNLVNFTLLSHLNCLKLRMITLLRSPET